MDRIETADRDLVQRCLSGDSLAWEEFVRRYVRLIAYVVRDAFEKWGRDSEEDVRDVTEEVYAHLVDQDFRVLRQLREPFNLKAWLAVVARRKARDYVRRRSLPAVSLETAPGLRDAALERLAGFPVDPRSDAADEVRRAVAEAPLTARERLMITLYFFRDKSYADVASLTGAPENSIGPTVRRALEKIRGALQKRGW
jgi:RNA polymerase sigma factor (sigma-70 family)